MSDLTIKQISPALPNKEKDSSSGTMDTSPNSTSKTPLSTLSPYVAEFVPRCLALKKGTLTSRESKWSSEKTAKRGATVDDWSSNVEEGDEHNSSRGWWEETPLKVANEKRSTVSDPKTHPAQMGKDSSEGKQRESAVSFSWRQERFCEGINSNWRSSSTDSNKKRVKSNEIMKFKREERKMDFNKVSQNTKHSGLSTSFGAKRFPGNESSRSREQREKTLRVTNVGQGQGQQRDVRTDLGIDRRKTAWGNDMHGDSIIGSKETRCINASDSSKISHCQDNERLGCSQGVWSNTRNLFGSNKATIKKEKASKLSKNKDNKNNESLPKEDKCIGVGSKNKIDEEKETEQTFVGNKLDENSKEINESNVESSLLNPHEKLEKLQRKDLKKERKRDKIDKEQKVDQNKDIISYNITSKDYRKQNSKHEEKRNDKIKSENQTKTCQEKESKKPEVVKIKTKHHQEQNDIKILLKKNHFPHEEQTSTGIPEFELQYDNEEFPDLVATCKPSSSSLASDWLSGGTRMPIISYSSVLKSMPKLKTQPYRHSDTLKESSEIPDKQSHDVKEARGKKKKKKKKKARNSEAIATQATQEPKKTKQPMQLDLGDWVSTIEKKATKPTKTKERNPKKVVTIAAGILQIKVKDQSTAIARAAKGKATGVGAPKTFQNVLDSTAPVVKRGKEREVPKKKKPSQLKKIILKEREEKRKALKEEEKDDGNAEPKSSLAEEETDVSKETSVVNKSEEKLIIEDCDPAINQDDVVTYEKGNTDVTSSYSSGDGDLSVAPSKDDIKAQIHSRRFREYCDNVMDKELDSTTLELLQKLVMFQDRLYHKDPIKFKAKRRFVVGLREVTKHLKLKKIKLVIISPNVERIKSAGGLDDTLYNIINIAHQNGVPVVFALRRQVLGRVLHKKVPVSAIGVFYYDGAQDQYKKLMDLTEKARNVYAQRWKTAYDELMERIQKERAVELSRDAQEESSERYNEVSRDKGVDDAENPKDCKDKVKTNCVYGNIEIDFVKNEGKEKWENESECNIIKETVMEKEKETKDEISEQKIPSVSEESEDEKECECEEDSINSEQIEPNESNEIEDECNGDNRSVFVETDLAVEDL